MFERGERKGRDSIDIFTRYSNTQTQQRTLYLYHHYTSESCELITRRFSNILTKPNRTLQLDRDTSICAVSQ